MTGAGLLLALASAALALLGLGMTGHMAAHMLAVCVAAPAVALGLPRAAVPGGPFAMMVLELATVWGWHLPALRDAADMSVALTLMEQACFLLVGIALWRASLADPARGVAALLLTSMHMTLLGALIALASRPLYAGMAMHTPPNLDALTDQQLGGTVMLALGGASYLAGGLWLMAGLLRRRVTA